MNLKNYILALTLMLGCTNPNDNRNYTISGLNVVDSSPKSNSRIDSSIGIIYEGIPVYYIGNKSYNVFLSKYPISRHISRFMNNVNPITELDSNFIRLSVYDEIETSMFLSNDSSNNDKTAYAANLILIENISNNYLKVGIANMLMDLCIETQTEDLDWQIINNQLNAVICGTGLSPLILQPKGVVVGKIPKHNGNTKMRSRLKYKSKKGVVYSNEFQDFYCE